MPDGSLKNMGNKIYKIKRVPPPKITYGNLKNGGKYSKSTLMAQQFIYAILDDFYFNNISYKVVSYNAIVYSKNKTSEDKKELSNSTKPIHTILKDSKQNEILMIWNIKVKGPSGERTLDEVLNYTIQ